MVAATDNTRSCAAGPTAAGGPQRLDLPTGYYLDEAADPEIAILRRPDSARVAVLDLTRSSGHLSIRDESPGRRCRVPGPTPRYPAEFKEEAVRLYRSSRRSFSEVASELGISEETLRRWTKQAEIDHGQREGLTTAEQEELRRLRKEVKTLRQEKDILRKATAFFAREDGIR